VTFSEHFGENRVILLQTVAKWRCIKLCAFFLDHSVVCITVARGISYGGVKGEMSGSPRARRRFNDVQTRTYQVSSHGLSAVHPARLR